MGRHDWILTRCGRRGRGTLRGHAPPATTMVVCIQYTTNRVQCFRYASMCIATMAEIGAPGRAMVVCCVPALVFDRPQTALSSDGGRRPCRPALPSLPCLKPEGDRAKGCGPRTSTFICLQCQTCQKKKGDTQPHDMHPPAGTRGPAFAVHTVQLYMVSWTLDRAEAATCLVCMRLPLASSLVCGGLRSGTPHDRLSTCSD